MVHLWSVAQKEIYVERHPHFADFVSGVLWKAACVNNGIGTLPENPAEIAALNTFTEKLARIGPGFCWEPPPELYAEFMLDTPPAQDSLRWLLAARRGSRRCRGWLS